MSRIFEMILDGSEFDPPFRLLSDLSPEQALAVPPGAPYSIAQQVAHAVFWQDTFLSRLGHGEAPPRGSGANGDWPSVTPEGWPDLVRRFLGGLAAAEGVTNYDSISGDVLVGLALHDMYYLGQIALLRQLAGLWPPIGGDDTWEEPLNPPRHQADSRNAVDGEGQQG